MRWLGVAAAVALAQQPATAGGDNDWLRHLAQQVRTRLDAIVAAKAPRFTPPTPIAVKWGVRKVGNYDLGAPIVAIAAAELDGDRRSGELYAVTTREVVALAFRNGRVVELGRVAFSGERAAVEPRDPVGTVVVDGGEVVAAASPWAKELRVSWNGKQLVGKAGAAGFLVCPGERAQLQTGRNHFTGGTFSVRCRSDLVDKTGVPLQVRAELATTNRLAVTVKRCPPNAACEDAGNYELPKVGTAFEIADVDRDGTPELIVSDASAPGDADTARVLVLGTPKPIYRTKAFAGGVVGVVQIDGDDPDDVPEIVVVTRLVGISRVDFWRID